MKYLDRLVTEALINAAENGHLFQGWTPREIALDMIECCSDFEHFHIHEIEMAIRRVQTESKS